MECDGVNGPHVFVATIPLDGAHRAVLSEVEIACIERGERVR